MSQIIQQRLMRISTIFNENLDVFTIIIDNLFQLKNISISCILDSMKPVRKIKKSNRSVTGYFMSKKNKRQITFESTLERDLFLTLEFDDSVIAYSEQPMTISYVHDGSKRRYTPDCLVQYSDHETIFEAKYQNELDEDAQLRHKLNSIKSHFEQNTPYDFKIFTDRSKHPDLIQNLKFLYKFAFLKPSPDLTQQIYAVWMNLIRPVSIKEFLFEIDSNAEHHSNVLPYLWHFIFIHPNAILLNQKLTMKSSIQAGAICQN